MSFLRKLLIVFKPSSTIVVEEDRLAELRETLIKAHSLGNVRLQSGRLFSKEMIDAEFLELERRIK